MVSKRELAAIGIFFSIISHSLMYSIYFPVSVQMVQGFNTIEKKFEIGETIGKISAYYFFGEALSYFLTPLISAKLGYSKSFLLSIISTIVLSMSLAYSEKYDSVILIRFLQGLFCPIHVLSSRIVKSSYIRNPKKSSFLIRATYLGGTVSGFLIGGSLKGKSFISENPYFLSSFFVLLTGTASFVLVFFYLKKKIETPKTDVLSLYNEMTHICKSPGFINLGLFVALFSTGSCMLELSIVWIWTSVKDGGFELGFKGIWVVLFSAGVLSVTYVAFVHKRLFGHIKSLDFIKESTKFFAFSSLLFPIFGISNLITSSSYILLIFGLFLYFSIYLQTEFTLMKIIKTDDQESDIIHLKEPAIIIGKLSKSLAVYFICNSFSQHAKEGNKYPNNYAYPFNVLAALFIISFVLSYFLKKVKVSEFETQNSSNSISLLDQPGEVREEPEKTNELKLLSFNK